MSWPRHGCAIVIGLFFWLAFAHAQISFTEQNIVHSVSGQFIVSSEDRDGRPFFRALPTGGNTNVIRLEPALLAVAAERFKISLWQQLGLKSDAPWSGKIFLALHPARSLDETVTITSHPFNNHWDYRVEFPDALVKPHYARALAAVLLLEIANRTATTGSHSAEIPAWLVDGFARQVLAADGQKVILSAPAKEGGGLPVGRLDEAKRDFDPLAGARLVLQNLPVLTFDQLSWPTDAQVSGDDGGAYLASAQLFASQLLALKNGADKMRALLAELPDHLNWQTAFFDAFRENFKRPLDVEKWWALSVVNFAQYSAGPRWTTAVSRERLPGLLSVPVEFRSDSNALPGHAEISLQSALQHLSPAQRDAVLRTKLRDLALDELRLAPPFGALADGYRNALADFLGELKKPAPVSIANKQRPTTNRNASLADTLKKLDALDRYRREAEAKAAFQLPGNLPASAPRN